MRFAFVLDINEVIQHNFCFQQNVFYVQDCFSKCIPFMRVHKMY